MTKLLRTIPTTIKQANIFIRKYHRHHRPTTNNCGRWAIAAMDNDDRIVGVAIAGNPVSASLMDGFTLELTRICVNKNAPKGTCSFLLTKCCSIWRMMGGNRVVTYTLETESGSSLRGAGWELTAVVAPHKRWTNKSKKDGIKREDLQVYHLRKQRWEKFLGESEK